MMSFQLWNIFQNVKTGWRFKKGVKYPRQKTKSTHLKRKINGRLIQILLLLASLRRSTCWPLPCDQCFSSSCTVVSCIVYMYVQRGWGIFYMYIVISVMFGSVSLRYKKTPLRLELLFWLVMSPPLTCIHIYQSCVKTEIYHIVMYHQDW